MTRDRARSQNTRFTDSTTESLTPTYKNWPVKSRCTPKTDPSVHLVVVLSTTYFTVDLLSWVKSPWDLAVDDGNKKFSPFSSKYQNLEVDRKNHWGSERETTPQSSQPDRD